MIRIGINSALYSLVVDCFMKPCEVFSRITEHFPKVRICTRKPQLGTNSLISNCIKFHRGITVIAVHKDQALSFGQNSFRWHPWKLKFRRIEKISPHSIFGNFKSTVSDQCNWRIASKFLSTVSKRIVAKVSQAKTPLPSSSQRF